jgi:hypothetical protein
MTNGYVTRPPTMNPKDTWAYKEKSKEFSRHKFGRLQREIKKHSQNCFKRQHKMLQLQDMIYRKSAEYNQQSVLNKRKYN